MTLTPTREQLRGLSYEVASLYGMPHLGASYTADSIADTVLDEGAVCACCGRRATNAHHEPPRSKGPFLLRTGMGAFVLKPALIALCGHGTAGCHGERHNRLLAIRWEWDADDFAEAWWEGYLLSHRYAPHDPRLFKMGRYVLSRQGGEWEARL